MLKSTFRLYTSNKTCVTQSHHKLTDYIDRVQRLLQNCVNAQTNQLILLVINTFNQT